MQLLTNGGFEGHSWRKTFDGSEWGEILVPFGWVAFWDAEISRPEMKLAYKNIYPMRVAEGEKSAQWFTFYRNHDAGLYQQASVPSGATVRLTASAHAWYSQGDDPAQSEYKDEAGNWQTIRDGQPGMDLMIGLDLTGGTDWRSDTVTWYTANYYEGFGTWSMDAAPASSVVTVFLRSRTEHTFKHCDAYFDDVQLEVISTSSKPCDPVGYRVVVNLLPQDTTKEEFAHVLEHTYDQRETILYSADDAARLVAPGIDGSFVRVWSPDRWDDYIIPWLEMRGVEFVAAAYLPGDEPGPTPPPTPPEPPTEPQYELKSTNLLGFHMMNTKQDWPVYYEQAQPTAMKWFSCGHAVDAKRRFPDVITNWRKYVGNEQGRIGEHPTPKDAAQWYLDLYSAEIETHAAATGMTVDEVLAHIDAIEALNETIPSGNEETGAIHPVIEIAVDCDYWFAELCHQRYGDALQTVLLNVAIGNPGHHEEELLLPAAEQVFKYGGFLGYHCYWTRNEHESFIDTYWEHHAGRWTRWDETFRSHGVYPRYLSTEGGIVYAADGTSFSSGQGWKSCGSFERYLQDMDDFNLLAGEWNAEHGNRFAGLELFGYGLSGWDNFEIGHGDMLLMVERAQAKWLK